MTSESSSFAVDAWGRLGSTLTVGDSASLTSTAGREAAWEIAATQASQSAFASVARLYDLVDLGWEIIKGKYSTSPTLVGLIISTLQPVSSIDLRGLMSSFSR